MLFSKSAIAQEDSCKSALSDTKSGIINVIKIQTNKSSLFSSETEISRDCIHFTKFISVNNPDAIKTQGGLCAVLPASEIQPHLCSLRVKLCIAKDDCRVLKIKLIREAEHYIKAVPAYFEMRFN